MRILVTGGCGFIGSDFIHMLLTDMPDVDICNLDSLTYAGNPANLEGVEGRFAGRYTFARADIADLSAVERILAEQRIEAVVNFAAETHVDRSIADAAPFLHTNVLGLHALLTAAQRRGLASFVHVSTDEVYGSLTPEAPAFTEADPLVPNSPYSASKASGDLLCRAWHETYAFPVIVTRCSNNYGPRQFPEKLIPFMYFRACEDQPLPVYGTGKNVRDWIHVRDHCRGIWLALTRGRPGAVYNFGGAAERSNLTVVHRILDFCGKPASLIRFVADRPGHDFRYAMDYSLARRELGFAPSRTFEQGLAETLDWYRGNPAWISNVTSGAYRTFLKTWYGDRL
ncbi:MAG: dTDP-glucose 4,6-dehydratase [Desulfovibrio sp.]|jgi:dTDP-glucose 4,6-dehydratase|nr:dTDP-glucose 4,6-dehydratase [Desulfovibrio sp.]